MLVRHFYFACICSLLITAIACQPTKTKTDTASAASKQPADYTLVNVAEFKALAKDPAVVILDVRTPSETANGMIAGAINIDVKDPSFSEQIQSLSPDKTYLVYCRSGQRSNIACDIMASQGFTKLYNLSGGYLGWEE